MLYSVLYVLCSQGSDTGPIHHITVYADSQSDLLSRMHNEHGVYTNSIISITARNFY